GMLRNPPRPVTFGTPVQALTGGLNPGAAVVADCNGDGKPDLAVANAGDPSGNGAAVTVLLGRGDGTFLPPVTTAVAPRLVSLVAADFTHDGKIDLAINNRFSPTVGVLLGNGDGSFQPAVAYGSATVARALAVGDFNGDREVDLAVVNAPTNTVSVLLGNG